MCADTLHTSSAGIDRVPPHDEEAERSVLGSLLLDKDAVDIAIDMLKDEAFYTPAHRLIFGAVHLLSERREPCDLVTVSSLLQTRNEIEKAGGAAYLSGLAASVPTTANVEYYAKIVFDKWNLRELLRASHQIANDCFHGEGTCEEIMEQAEQRIFKLAQNKKRQGFVALKDMMTEVIEHLEKLQNRPGGLTGVGTGFAQLDDLTSGLHGGELVIVAARPSVGKTAFTLNIAEHVAVNENRAVAIFSLEMAARDLMMRLISAHARVEGQRLRKGTLTTRDWTAIIQAGTALSKAEILIDDSPHLSPLEVNARCRRLKSENPNLAMVIIDYIQLLTGGGKRIEDRQQEVSYISRALKALAREIDVPVVALSQLNRESERGQESPKRPQLSQLRESGAIEQDADVVMLLYRPGMFSDDPKLADRAEVILAKQRNGPTGIVTLQYLRDYARFDNPPPGFMDAYTNES